MGYEVNDKVVVVSSSNEQTAASQEYTVCNVVAVGKFDLVCSKVVINSFKRIFKVSKKRCLKINLECSYTDHKTIEPKLGDLVISMTDKYEKDIEAITGIVEKILYDPLAQQQYIYFIRTGQKTVRCYLNNMIILEQN